MAVIRRQSVIQQTASHLLTEIQQGRWREGLPGIRRLAEELGVSRGSLRAAVRLLESEGHVSCHGSGRRRQASSKPSALRQALRIGVLLQSPHAKQNAEMQRTLADLRHDVEVAGHVMVVASKAHQDLGDDPRKLSRLVADVEADAWIVVAGSRALLEWFSAQDLPAVAFGGACVGLPLAGSGIDFVPPIRAAVRHLVSLGHRRLVLIAPRHWREPKPSRILQAYFDELLIQGIPAGEYNAPTWEEDAAGLYRLLHSLFRVTPPSALLIVEPPRVLAVMQFLNQQGLRVPSDVSLVCLGQDSMFDWCEPPVAHVRYDLNLPMQRIVKWIAAISHGTSERKIRLFPAQFDTGGSTGPAIRN